MQRLEVKVLFKWTITKYNITEDAWIKYLL